MNQRSSRPANILVPMLVVFLSLCGQSVRLHAQTLQNIPPLSFTMPAGSAGPLPQVLSLASATGTNFDFGIRVSTTSGGNWLSVSGGPNCCSTPWAITVNVTSVSALPAGTYNGEVDFTKWPTGELLLAVPVSLLIEPVGTTFIDGLPGELSFSMATSANNPPAQVLRIRNGGTGTLSWSMSVSTADGGNWLQPSITSGTTPSSITVNFVAANLPGGGASAGNFSGQLLFQSGGDSVTVPVSATVGASVFRQSNPITFTMKAGAASPLSQVVQIASTGTNFDFGPTVSTSSGGNWLNFNAGGPNCCATPWAITLDVINASALPVGTYTGQVVLNKFPYATLAITIPVTLFVEPATTPFFSALPGALTFSMKTASGTPPAQSIQVRNGGSGKLPWTLTVTTSDGNAWLKASTLSGTAPKPITVSTVRSLLPGGGTTPGVFAGQLLFVSGADSVTVPVSMNVGNPVFAQTNPLKFVMLQGSSNPLPQVLTVASTGTNFDFTLVTSTSSGGNWLSLATGANCCATPWAVTVIISNASTLPVGTYTGQVMVNRWGSTTFSMVVPVTLTVVSSMQPLFENPPGETSFGFAPGSTVIDQVVPVYFAGAGTLNWTASKSTADGHGWLTISPTSGTAPATVTVHINRTNLPGHGLSAGTFVGQQVLKTTTGSVTIPVSVTIGTQAFVPLPALTFTASAGTNPPDQTVTVSSTGTNMDFSWLASTGEGGKWLTLLGGINCCTTPWTVTVRANSSSLPPGTYIGQAIFTQEPGNINAMTLPVILTITP